MKKMPNRDKTGPEGKGAKTGRQMGTCKDAVPIGIYQFPLNCWASGYCFPIFPLTSSSSTSMFPREFRRNVR